MYFLICRFQNIELTSQSKVLITGMMNEKGLEMKKYIGIADK